MKIHRLNESDIERIVRKVIKEQNEPSIDRIDQVMDRYEDELHSIVNNHNEGDDSFGEITSLIEDLHKELGDLMDEIHNEGSGEDVAKIENYAEESIAHFEREAQRVIGSNFEEGL